MPHGGYCLNDILDDGIDANGAALNMNPSTDHDIDANGAALNMNPSAEGFPALLQKSPPWRVAERSPPVYLN